MLPVLTIIGRPNVGKSTLFNYITKTRNAIVANIPGVTRDRQYGEATFQGRDFIVVDTGGIAEPDDPEIGALTAAQVVQALDEADVILFLLDAKVGLTNGDRDIAAQLRRYPHKKILLAINKTDREQGDIASSEFYELGFEKLFAIASTTGRGIEALLTAALLDFSANASPNTTMEARTRIAIIGRPNVGKSTLINCLLGEERVVVLDRPGTTRDAIAIPYDRRGKKYTLIDTAGVRRRSKAQESIETFSVIKALQAMRQAHVVILVIDARDGLTEQDMRLLGLVMQSGNAFVLAFNKWDHMDEYQKEQMKQNIDRKLVFATFARRYFISAKHGTNVGKLYDAIDEAQAALSQEFMTSELTRLLMEATEEHQPPLVRGRRVKCRYAHIGSKHPLLLVIHGKQVENLPGSYKTYLINYFRNALHLTGVPLMIKFLNDENPFVNSEE